jgi:putative ABC transport system substrate-binding protein
MRRRAFIAGLGSAAAWPLAARAQQGDRVRRVAVLLAPDKHDPHAKALVSAFTQGLAELGWIDGRNIQIDVRWTAGSADRARIYAKELVDLQPDVIFVISTAATAALQRQTRTVPIVFVNVVDPVGAGFVAGLPRPAGNTTGFTNQEAATGGKWLELLTEIAPRVKRAAAMFNPDAAYSSGTYSLPSFETAARALRVEAIRAPIRNDAEIETVMNSLGSEPGSGLVVMPNAFATVHRAQIILLAARNNVPAVYSDSVFARDGGLLSYGADRVDNCRRAASYVDRILRGAKPADLPVQLPVKFEMAVNVKTARALGLTVPQSILLRADEVIE